MNQGPRFDELVGNDLPAAERERLLRVHELLIAAGPPPDGALSTPPPALPERASARRWTRPRRLGLVALAAALALAVFGAGFFVGDRGPGTFEVLDMIGTSEAADARATLEVFDLDDAGNWPMELEIEGLQPSERPYELWLTKNGRLAALCGSFLVEPEGTTEVPLNAPYKLRDYDEWVVVREGSETPLLST
jgi:hypothetical protein